MPTLNGHPVKIKRNYGQVVTVELLDLPMVRNIHGKYKYQVRVVHKSRLFEVSVDNEGMRKQKTVELHAENSRKRGRGVSNE